jgi:formylglycine-generating enzyme required for sulfatase activity
MPPPTVSHYRLVRSLGRGNFGEVFEGVHQHDDHIRVAVKVLHAGLAADADFVGSLRAECRVLARLKHPHIVGFRELVIRDGAPPAMVLDLATGGSLEDRVARGPVPPGEVLGYLREALSALAYAHEEGVIHRDIKPGNLLLDGRGRIQVADFGIAKAADSGRSTRTGTIMGTLAFMAPELFDGAPATAQSDLYALGLVVWELLVGRAACPAPTLLGAMRWHDAVGAPSLVGLVPGLPAGLGEVVASLTAREPVARPSGALPVIEALRGVGQRVASAAPVMLGTGQIGGAGLQAGASASGRPVVSAAWAARGAPPAGRQAAPPAPSAHAVPPPLPAAQGAAAGALGAPPRWFYAGADGQPRELLLEAVVLLVVAAPNEVHLVWRPGQSGWAGWEAVPEVSRAVAAARPQASEPPPVWKGRRAGERRTVSGRGASAFSFDVVYIPPGEFEMGSPPDEEGRRDDESQHRVRLTRGVEMSVVPVTQAVYAAAMGAYPSYFEGDNLPVADVSWFDAVRLCNAVSRFCGLPEAYSIGAGDTPEVQWSQASGGFRLPTEAEWEYAARAGTGHIYAGGDDLAAVGWFGGNSGGSTQAVGQQRANAWGLHDMSGNVWEWCWDWRTAYPSGMVVDPTGPPSGSNRVRRGGSLRSGPKTARVAVRGSDAPGNRSYSLGVRLLRTVT